MRLNVSTLTDRADRPVLHALAFSPDGQRLFAMTDRELQVYVWPAMEPIDRRAAPSGASRRRAISVDAESGAIAVTHWGMDVVVLSPALDVEARLQLAAAAFVDPGAQQPATFPVLSVGIGFERPGVLVVASGGHIDRAWITERKVERLLDYPAFPFEPTVLGRAGLAIIAIDGREPLVVDLAQRTHRHFGAWDPVLAGAISTMDPDARACQALLAAGEGDPGSRERRLLEWRAASPAFSSWLAAAAHPTDGTLAFSNKVGQCAVLRGLGGDGVRRLTEMQPVDPSPTKAPLKRPSRCPVLAFHPHDGTLITKNVAGDLCIHDVETGTCTRVVRQRFAEGYDYE